MYHALQGIRVIEGSSFIAAPYCGMLLSQLGAEVIRFDPIGGGPDFHRWPLAPGGESFYWEGLNKGKKSVCINLSDSDGRELAVALVTAAGEGQGIFVTNFPEGSFLSHEKLAARRHDIIVARIMGRADGSSAVDYTINCAVGLPNMTGPAELAGTPVNHVLPAWDLLAGSTAALSVLAAVDHRRQTGAGQHIRVPLSDIAAATLGNLGQIAEVLVSGADRPRTGNNLFGAFGRDFLTRDGKRLMVVALTVKQWDSLVASLEIGAAVSALEAELGVSFKTDEGNRFRHRGRLDPIVETAIAKLPHAALVERFNAKGVCFGQYRSLHEAVTDDPEFAANNPVFSEVLHPSGHSYPTPGYPASFSGLKRSAMVSAPQLGQHTEQVLSEVLGLPGHAIADLYDRGIVATAGRSS